MRILFALAWAVLCLGPASEAASWGPVTIRENSVAPGEMLKFRYAKTRTFVAEFLDFPIWVARSFGLGIVVGGLGPEAKARLFRETAWVRVPPGQGGFFFPALELGAVVAPGDLLGSVTDPQSDLVHEIRSPQAGEVIGMAVPQVVLSGYALFHLGLDP